MSNPAWNYLKADPAVRVKLVIPLTALLLLLFVLSGISVYFYLQQKQLIGRLAAELADEQLKNRETGEALQRLTVQIDALREQLQEMEREQAAQEEATAGGSGPTAYLTIDDGPSGNTIQILKILDDYRIRATFFVTGHNCSGDEQIYRRIHEAGHALGNHTYTHNIKTIYQSKDVFMADLMRLEELLFQQTGVRPDIVRFPGGTSNTVARQGVVGELIGILKNSGYDYFDWNVSFGDGNVHLPPHEMLQNVITQADRLGGRDAVVLLHDHYMSHNTVTALPQVIEALQARGYDFAPLKKGVVNVKHR